MLVTDLLHSCANDRVAEAAVFSIGGDFVDFIRAEAEDEGVSVGQFTARAVRAFALAATERDWRDLTSAVRGHDLPVLAGLQLILTRHRRSAWTTGRPGRDYAAPGAFELAAAAA